MTHRTQRAAWRLRRFETKRTASCVRRWGLSLCVLIGMSLISHVANGSAPIVWDKTVSPGGLIHFEVLTDQSYRVRAYLPGLGPTTSRVEYNWTRGVHAGFVKVPATAPRQGFLTLRIVVNERTEHDYRIYVRNRFEPI